MKIKLATYFPRLAALSAAILSLFLLACTPQTPANTTETGPANARSTAAANAASSSMAVEVSPELVAEFAATQQAINEDWDQFHADFDRWRAGLTACDRSAALAALRGFGGDFSDITEQARDLPGEGIARDLPIKAVEAATMEEAALRQLRDNWQPGNVALLEQVQEARSQASLLLRETSIAIDELEELDKPEDQEAAEEFSDAFTPVDADWDAFHDAYETLLDDQYELGAAEMVERLKALIDELELIEDALDDLPSEAVTDDIAEALTAAVSEEAKGLKVLLGAFSRLARTEAAVMVPAAVIVPANGDEEEGESENGAAGSDMIPDVVSDGAPASTPMPMPVPTPTPTPMPTPTPYQAAPAPADNSDLFEAMDEQVDNSNRVRKKAKRDLDGLIEGVSEEDKEALAAFTAAFDRLMGDLDDFHEDYDGWIRTEGDCDRAKAAAALGQFSQRFSELGTRVRGLSQAPYLRPTSDLLAEAVGREEAALRSLRNTWAPFENDVYRGLDQERTNAENLRRLAGRRTQEVVERFGAVQ
jgi:hypothetical protein